jgi:hypothetical protein
MQRLVDRWNATYFNERLSPEACQLLDGLQEAPAEACAFAERIFRLMRASRFDAADVSRLLAWQIGVIAPRILPNAWGGMVPPITAADRHRKIDDYAAANPWHCPAAAPGRRRVMLDLGCGFPPLTTMDSAEALSDWYVIGADPAFGRYIVYDAQGDYACFVNEEDIRYFQPGIVDEARWEALHRDHEATRAHFRDLLHALLPVLPETDEGELQEVERDGARLVRNAIRHYERPNLAFLEGGIGSSLELGESVDVIRCMNVLIYFDRPFRDKALRWAAPLLVDDGLFICGMNSMTSCHARYCVYRKESGRLVPREFAFGIENVRPIEFIAWYTLHDDDPDALLLAELVGELRSDHDFRSSFDQRLDTLLADVGICPRGPDGYLGGLPEHAMPGEVVERFAALLDRLRASGLTDSAVKVLRASGREAWRNCIGDVATLPVEPRIVLSCNAG